MISLTSAETTIAELAARCGEQRGGDARRLIDVPIYLDGLDHIFDRVPNAGQLSQSELQQLFSAVHTACAQQHGEIFAQYVRFLSWRLSITMEASFCVATLEDAMARHGKPEIFNTDQGSQFTGAAFTGALASNGIAISMDGKGAWRDNVFVERLWRSVKYEEVYLRAYDSVGQARSSIGRYLDFYNSRRPHSSLDGGTPDQAYFNPLPLRLAA